MQTFPTSSLPTSLKDIVKRGYDFLGRSEHGAAAGCFEIALGLRPSDAKLRSLYGVSLLLAGRADEAVEVLRESAAVLPDDAAIQLNFGIALNQTKDHDGAIAAFEKVLQLDPSLQVAIRNMANAKMHQCLFKEAIKLYYKYHSSTPGDVQIWPNVISCHIQDGDRTGAFKAAADGYTAGCRDLNFWENVAEIYREFDDYAAIRSIYMFILRRWPDAHDAGLVLATIALEHGDFQTGWTLYERRFLAERSR